MRANFKVAIICLALQLVCASRSEAQANNSLALGSKDQIVYIDIKKLRTEIKTENKPIFDLYDAKRKPESFYHKFIWAPDKCWAGSELHERVIAYCLPYVRLGEHVSQAYYQYSDKFVSIGPCIGIFVWYDQAMNRFYIWSVCWNFSNVLGPFVGNPKVRLNEAVKPRKPQRHLRDVKLSVVSQRWLYPDEREARVPRNNFYYDCSHDAPCGRDIEQQNLNTFITRFRLSNNNKQKLYYLANFSSDDPVGYTLSQSDKRTDLERAVIRDTAEERMDRKWKPLLPGSSVEFEVQERAWKVGEALFGVLVNTEPKFWDEIEVLGKYSSMFRALKEDILVVP